MSADQALFSAYREWQRLAKAAQRAIDKRDWPFLLECQQIVKKLQPLISDLTLKARGEWRQRKEITNAKEEKLRSVVSDLMALIESNRQSLRLVHAAALLEREKMIQAGLNLKRLQNSYLSTHPSAWTSFS